MFLSDEVPTLETLDYTIRIGSTPTFLYFNLYLHSAYAAHYVYYQLAKFVCYDEYIRRRVLWITPNLA